MHTAEAEARCCELHTSKLAIPSLGTSTRPNNKATLWRQLILRIMSDNAWHTASKFKATRCLTPIDKGTAWQPVTGLRIASVLDACIAKICVHRIHKRCRKHLQNSRLARVRYHPCSRDAVHRILTKLRLSTWHLNRERGRLRHVQQHRHESEGVQILKGIRGGAPSRASRSLATCSFPGIRGRAPPRATRSLATCNCMQPCSQLAALQPGRLQPSARLRPTSSEVQHVHI